MALTSRRLETYISAILIVDFYQAMVLDQYLTGVGRKMAAWAAWNELIEGLWPKRSWRNATEVSIYVDWSIASHHAHDNASHSWCSRIKMLAKKGRHSYDREGTSLSAEYRTRSSEYRTCSLLQQQQRSPGHWCSAWRDLVSVFYCMYIRMYIMVTLAIWLTHISSIGP